MKRWVGAFDYSQAIQRLVRERSWQEALACFEDARQRPHLALDLAAFQAAAAACEQGGQWEMAIEVLRCSRLIAGEPSDQICAIAASACANTLQWRVAVAILSDMRWSGSATLCATISACHRAGQWQEALSLLMSPPALKVATPDATSYNCVADACAQARQWEKAMLVLMDMCARGPPPDRGTHAVLNGLPWSAPGEVYQYAAVPRPHVLPAPAVRGSADPTVLEDHGRQAAADSGQSTAAGSQHDESARPAEAVVSGLPPADPPVEEEAEEEPLSYRVLPSGEAIIDLHGLPVEVSKIAVQVALEDLILGGGPGSKRRGPTTLRDLIIITGIGNNSPGKIALVRPAIIHFLREQLRISVLETRRDGPGRLRVPASELQRLCGVPAPR